jgi:hypothetical protein
MSADWEHTSRERLADELGRIRAMLRATMAQPQGQERAGGDVAVSPPAVRPNTRGAIDILCELFHLSPFERDLLLLCAGVELDSGIAEIIASASGEARIASPTFSLALAALPNAHWSAIAPSGPLRRWRLITVGNGPAVLHSPLRIEERVLHHLAGMEYIDARLAGIACPVAQDSLLAPGHRALADRLAAAWCKRLSGALPLVQLCGGHGAERRGIAAAACRALGLGLYAVPSDGLPSALGEIEALARLWEREATLAGLALLVECQDLDGDNARLGAARRLAEQVSGAVIVAGPERLPDIDRSSVALEVSRLTASEQRSLWRNALGPVAVRLNGQLDQVAAQFSLGPGAIRDAARLVSAAEQEDDLGSALWDACRTQARPKLDDLAQRIETAATWDDLVLPEVQIDVLRGVLAHVRQRATVYEAWGFGRKSGRGLGVTTLFAGPSGTGKTLAAEVLANELRLDLYRVDLSQVVSKYIGDTEKNLRRVFDAAEDGGVVLLFDEADALFGKRSDVRDSHDRYANVEVSYLLQRMEAYRGLAVLTTNMKQAIDGAFLRRIRFVITFPYPDTAQRAEIWRRAFPPETPTEGLDAEKLARLSMAGGNIANIALGAAVLAADAKRSVGMTHVLAAARAEYAKLDRTLSEAETAGWLTNPKEAEAVL